MAFVASKKRVRKEPGPVGVGKPLTPSAAIQGWYKWSMSAVVNEMLKDYKRTMQETLEHPEVERVFTQDDAAINSVFKRVMSALNKKWKSIFEGFARMTAPEFVDKVDTHNKSSAFFSMSAAGLEHPTFAYNDSVRQTLEASVDYNHTLITGIQQDLHESLYNSIMLSLTSPDPLEQGSSGIENALKKAGITAKGRVDLIARDQTSKLNASLATERMSEGGIEYLKWLHSSAGKEPRECHQDMDGGVFKIDDERFWHVGTIYFTKMGKPGIFSAVLKKGDVGPPGWAINCRCRSVPLIGYNPDEDDTLP